MGDKVIQRFSDHKKIVTCNVCGKPVNDPSLPEYVAVTTCPYCIKNANFRETSLVEILLPYALGDSEDGGEDYTEYSERLRDAIGVGQLGNALNEVADRMCEFKKDFHAKE